MKQKKQNRILAALLAVAMMFQMLPMLAFAAEETELVAPKVKIDGTDGTEYDNLLEALEHVKSGDTIKLGKGEYTLYDSSSKGGTASDMIQGMDLTFVGQGPETKWRIGPEVPAPGNLGTEYNSDYSFGGTGTITFQNMTLNSGDVNYLGFSHTNKTVVDHCVINGSTCYWGYQSAEFKDTTFNAPSGNYALWTYSSPIMTFDGCTFNASGKVIKVYNESGAQDFTVNFNNCTVNSISFRPGKQALSIDDTLRGNSKFIINISGDNTVKAALDKTTCSRVFGFGNNSDYNTGRTDVYVDGELVWGKKEDSPKGELKTHKYSAGEAENQVKSTPTDWTKNGSHYEREVTEKCGYCNWEKTTIEYGYTLVYDLNGGAEPDDAAADEYETKLRGTSDALAKAPVREGYQFLGWKINEGSSVYPAGKKISEITDLPQTGDITLTAQWEEITTPDGGSSGDGGSGDGGAGVVVAGALLGGAGYLLGTRLWLEGTFGFVPANRIELAMALWKRADCPAPVSTELYPDIDEDDTDAQAAARWCVEQDLMKDFARTNSDGTQTVKFKPYDYVFRPQSLVKWYKLEKLLNEQQSTNA